MAISTEFRGARSNPELRSRANQVLQQAAQQRPQLDLEQNKEQTKLSDEFLDEVSHAVQTGGGENLEALLGAMSQTFVERQAEKAGPGQESKGQEKKMEVEWAPEVRPGEIMAPEGYTGQLIFKESKEQPKEEGVKPAGKAGKGAKAKSPVGSGSSAPKKTNDNQSKSDDTVELTAESQKMAQKMQQGGMQPAGVDAKGGKHGGAKADERVDVFMPTSGVTQLVDVSAAGQLRPDGLLGTYRKLDNMPSFNGAILRKRTGKEIVEEHNTRRERGEKVDPLPDDQQKLMNPVATHQ